MADVGFVKCPKTWSNSQHDTLKGTRVWSFFLATRGDSANRHQVHLHSYRGSIPHMKEMLAEFHQMQLGRRRVQPSPFIPCHGPSPKCFFPFQKWHPTSYAWCHTPQLTLSCCLWFLGTLVCPESLRWTTTMLRTLVMAFLWRPNGWSDSRAIILIFQSFNFFSKCGSNTN